MKTTQYLLLTVMSLFASTAYAHPGEHSLTLSQLAEHVFSSGFHLSLMAGVVLSAVVIFYRSLVSKKTK